MSAEQYDSATVYFSDVSDFAELSTSYNPMQIVVILNEIYKYVEVFWTLDFDETLVDAGEQRSSTWGTRVYPCTN